MFTSVPSQIAFLAPGTFAILMKELCLSIFFSFIVFSQIAKKKIQKQ